MGYFYISCQLPTDLYKKIKDLRLHPSHTIIQNVKSMPGWPTLQESLLKNSAAGKWVFDNIQDDSSLLSQITAYREKNIRLYLQAHIDLLRPICIQPSKLSPRSKFL